MIDKGVLIRKQDGSLEPFCSGKLRRCVEVLLRETGFDPGVARPLTKAVGIHVKHRPGDVTSAYIFDCVAAVLKQTGLTRASDALTSHRERRGRRRAAICVVATQGHSVASWSKSRLAATLRDRHGLREAVARYLAGEIERKVLELDYTAVSTDLLSALVASELSAWGLASYGAEAAPSNRVATRVAAASSRPDSGGE